MSFHGAGDLTHGTSPTTITILTLQATRRLFSGNFLVLQFASMVIAVYAPTKAPHTPSLPPRSCRNYHGVVGGERGNNHSRALLVYATQAVSPTYESLPSFVRVGLFPMHLLCSTSMHPLTGLNLTFLGFEKRGALRQLLLGAASYQPSNHQLPLRAIRRSGLARRFLKGLDRFCFQCQGEQPMAVGRHTAAVGECVLEGSRVRARICGRFRLRLETPPPLCVAQGKFTKGSTDISA